MLFGNEKIKNEIIGDALKFAEKNQLRIVFGSVVGGISRGLQYADSDYDTRFLYIKKDFPHNIYIPRNEKENDLKLREYYNNKPYEWIPFWELSSFLQFLIEPYFENKLSYGLYHVVGWTFLSPYTWDPHGIKNKIMPIIETMFNGYYMLNYHRNESLRYLDKSKDKVIIKDYLYGIYSILAIDWILKYNSFPPIYMRSLLTILKNRELTREIEKLIETSLEISNQFIMSGNSKFMHASHNRGLINRVEIIEKYIEDIEKSFNIFIYRQNIQDDIEDKRRKIEYMYKIIDYSIHNEQTVIGVNELIGDNI